MAKHEHPGMMDVYKRGFTKVTEVIERVKWISTSSADIYFDTVLKTNDNQLNSVREQIVALEVEIKKFMAAANGKMEYLVNLEEFLVKYQEQTKQLEKEVYECAEEIHAAARQEE